MIELKVDPICENCPNFDAVSHRTELYADGTIVDSECIIQCEWEQRCRQIRAFLEKTLFERR